LAKWSRRWRASFSQSSPSSLTRRFMEGSLSTWVAPQRDVAQR
jgi:hypothetical protein